MKLWAYRLDAKIWGIFMVSTVRLEERFGVPLPFLLLVSAALVMFSMAAWIGAVLQGEAQAAIRFTVAGVMALCWSFTLYFMVSKLPMWYRDMDRWDSEPVREAYQKRAAMSLLTNFQGRMSSLFFSSLFLALAPIGLMVGRFSIRDLVPVAFFSLYAAHQYLLATVPSSRPPARKVRGVRGELFPVPQGDLGPTVPVDS